MDSGAADMAPVVRHFQKLLERGESTLTGLLEEKRKNSSNSIRALPPHTPLQTSPLHTSPHVQHMYGEVSFLLNIDDVDDDKYLELPAPTNDKTHLYQLEVTNNIIG